MEFRGAVRVASLPGAVRPSPWVFFAGFVPKLQVDE
jgi:hypothetical protein